MPMLCSHASAIVLICYVVLIAPKIETAGIGKSRSSTKLDRNMHSDGFKQSHVYKFTRLDHAPPQEYNITQQIAISPPEPQTNASPPEPSKPRPPPALLPSKQLNDSNHLIHAIPNNTIPPAPYPTFGYPLPPPPGCT